MNGKEKVGVTNESSEEESSEDDSPLNIEQKDGMPC